MSAPATMPADRRQRADPRRLAARGLALDDRQEGDRRDHRRDPRPPTWSLHVLGNLKAFQGAGADGAAIDALRRVAAHRRRAGDPARAACSGPCARSCWPRSSCTSIGVDPALARNRAARPDGLPRRRGSSARSPRGRCSSAGCSCSPSSSSTSSSSRPGRSTRRAFAQGAVYANLYEAFQSPLFVAIYVAVPVRARPPPPPRALERDPDGRLGQAEPQPDLPPHLDRHRDRRRGRLRRGAARVLDRALLEAAAMSRRRSTPGSPTGRSRTSGTTGSTTTGWSGRASAATTR